MEPSTLANKQKKEDILSNSPWDLRSVVVPGERLGGSRGCPGDAHGVHQFIEIAEEQCGRGSQAMAGGGLQKGRTNE